MGAAVWPPLRVLEAFGHALVPTAIALSSSVLTVFRLQG